jgi:dimethylhistidine N-methyltransferase
MQEFLEHVKNGLSQIPKKLSSRYFYDEKGDELFQQIMQLEEYYLPACEMEIIETQGKQIAEDISKEHHKLQIVELGAGDGSKTKHFLKQISPFFQQMEYVALDISPNILEVNKSEVENHVSGLKQSSIAGNYFETYKRLPETNKGRIVLFLGANIGNFLITEAIAFFKFVKSKLNKIDYFLVSFDLVKHPRKIIKAYDDSLGITRQFNLNLLARINRELGADFDTSKFDHFPFYNPITGITSSQLFSLENQEVHFPDGFVAKFYAFEAINVEVSKKFFWSDIEEIALKSGMKIRETYFDKNKEYAFVMFNNNE